MKICYFSLEKSRVVGFTLMVVWTMPDLAWSGDYDTTNFGSDKGITKERYIEALKPNLEFRTLGKQGIKKAVSVELKFGLNSFELTAAARDELNKLGRAFKDRQLSRYRFLIEGHTDATGRDHYNEILSDQRAESVKRYLVTTFGIEPSRLQTVGRGEYDLLDKEHPENAVNRRVQIVNLE